MASKKTKETTEAIVTIETVARELGIHPVTVEALLKRNDPLVEGLARALEVADEEVSADLDLDE